MEKTTYNENTLCLTFFLSFFTDISWSGDSLSIALMFPFQLNLPDQKHKSAFQYRH